MSIVLGKYICKQIMNFQLSKFTKCLHFPNSARPSRSRAAAIGFGSLAAINFRMFSLLDFLSSNNSSRRGHLARHRACAKGKPLRLPYYMYQVKAFVKPWFAHTLCHTLYYLSANCAISVVISCDTLVHTNRHIFGYDGICYWSKAIT